MIYHTPQAETSHFTCAVFLRYSDAMNEMVSASETFRQNLIRLRQERGLSAAELSRMAGLNDRAVKDIEEGRARSPKISTVFSIANALGVDPGEMLGLGPRAHINRDLLRFLEQYDEADQARILAALAAIAPRSRGQ